MEADTSRHHGQVASRKMSPLRIIYRDRRPKVAASINHRLT